MSSMRFKTLFIVFALVSVSVSLSGAEVSVRLKPGDTLYKISRKYKIPVSDLIRFNGIDNPDSLKVGTVIKIPSSYVVKKGDTLYGISKKLNLTIDELCRLNRISPEYVLKIGEVLYVPLVKKPAEKPEPVVKTPDTDDTDTADNILWPHNGKRIPITGKLKGEEILGKRGDAIISVSSGKVVWVAPYRGYGTLIMVETADKHIFAYGGNEETLVSVGDIVKPGMQIGRMGIDPIEKNAKAFFFVYKEGKPVDPRKAPRG